MQFEKITLKDLNKDIIKKYIKEILYIRNEYNIDDTYIDKVSKILEDFLVTIPTINDFENLILYNAEKEWQEEKKKYQDNIVNIFNKICSELRENKNFDDAYYNLYFLTQMKKVLGDKYKDLYFAMEKYHKIYHSNVENRIEKSKEYVDLISNLSSLYIAKVKEQFKKEYIELVNDEIRKYFIPNLDNELVKQKLDYVKKRNLYAMKLKINDKDVEELINRLYDKYKDEVPKSIFYSMIGKFILNNYSKLNEIISEPIDYDNYKKYQKASKLVKRLNLEYIKVDGPEVSNYLDIIYFDHKEKIYKCIKEDYTDSMYSDYDRYKIIFEEIKREIIKSVNKLDVQDIPTDEKILKMVTKSLEFNDENYTFDINKIMNTNLVKFIKYMKFVGLIDSVDNNYEDIYNILITNKYFIMQVVLPNLVENLELLTTIENISYVKHLSKKLDLDINKIDDMALLTKVSECKDDTKVNILGIDMIEKIFDSKYNNSEIYEILEDASDLISNMFLRNTKTIPYINGTNKYYKYSLYDSIDTDILISGINTDSCFRIGGVDSEFLRYCALDKNGFVIKITDLNDNFIGKASGFRNGNVVFINQLRTIYDISGYGYDSNYEAEKEEIIETFKMACDDILKYSDNNEKINFIVITQSYLLKNVKSNVNDDVTKIIGYYPMDNESDDWKSFLKNTKYIDKAQIDNFFTTDYGYYPLICVSNNMTLNKENVKFYDAKDVYRRKRNNIVVSKYNEELKQKIDRINAINEYLEEVNINKVDIPNDSYIFNGDNWYIVLNNNKDSIIDSCVIEKDLVSKIEYEEVLKKIEKSINNKRLIKG